MLSQWPYTYFYVLFMNYIFKLYDLNGDDCTANNFHIFFNWILFMCFFDILKELTVKIKTAGWSIFFILYDKQDDVNYRMYNVF